jgi:hypothetical protein
MADTRQFEFIYEDQGEEPWLKMSEKSTVNLKKAIKSRKLEVYFFDMAAVGRLFVFDDVPSDDGPWHLTPKHRGRLVYDPIVVRVMIPRLLEAEASMDCPVGYNITLKSPLSGETQLSINIGNTNMSVRNFVKKVCEEMQINAATLMYKGEVVQLIPRLTLKKLFGLEGRVTKD